MKPIDLAYLHDEETRTTDVNTGGMKGVKLTQIGALDPIALIELGRIAGMGANKYAPFNYLRGFDWSKAYNAGQRHRNLFWAGEDRDLESGLPHIAHAVWMDLCLLSFYLRGIGNDDRPPALPSKPSTDGRDHGPGIAEPPLSNRLDPLEDPVYEFTGTTEGAIEHMTRYPSLVRTPLTQEIWEAHVKGCRFCRETPFFSTAHEDGN